MSTGFGQQASRQSMSNLRRIRQTTEACPHELQSNRPEGRAVESETRNTAMSKKGQPREKSANQPPKKWLRADHAQRRAMVVEHAIRLLTRHGPDAVTMRRVAGSLRVGTMTLYTYVDGQDGLQRAMTERGFEMLHQQCAQRSTYETDQSWIGGAMSYIQFAIEHPNLFKLMFDVPMSDDDDIKVLQGGFAGLHEVVKQRLQKTGTPMDALDAEAKRLAGQYWIGLHGIATLAVSGRLAVLDQSLENLLADMLKRIAPTKPDREP